MTAFGQQGFTPQGAWPGQGMMQGPPAAPPQQGQVWQQGATGMAFPAWVLPAVQAVQQGQFPHRNNNEFYGQIAPTKNMPNGFSFKPGGNGGGQASLQFNVKVRKSTVYQGQQKTKIVNVRAVAWGQQAIALSQQLRVGVMIAFRGEYRLNYVPATQPGQTAKTFPQVVLQSRDPEAFFIVGMMQYVDERPPQQGGFGQPQGQPGFAPGQYPQPGTQPQFPQGQFPQQPGQFPPAQGQPGFPMQPAPQGPPQGPPMQPMQGQVWAQPQPGQFNVPPQGPPMSPMPPQGAPGQQGGQPMAGPPFQPGNPPQGDDGDIPF